MIMVRNLSHLVVEHPFGEFPGIFLFRDQRQRFFHISHFFWSDLNAVLTEHGAPVLGVVYVPVTGVCYLAVRGQGAWKEQGGCNRMPIRVRRYHGGHATVVASRSHRGDAVDKFLANLKAREGDYDTASLGSSLKLCRVAEGAADVYPRLGPTSEWDTAAAQCVVESAGGRVTDLDGQPLRYNKPNILNPWFLVTGGNGYNWHALLGHAG